MDVHHWQTLEKLFGDEVSICHDNTQVSSSHVIKIVSHWDTQLNRRSLDGTRTRMAPTSSALISTRDDLHDLMARCVKGSQRRDGDLWGTEKDKSMGKARGLGQMRHGSCRPPELCAASGCIALRRSSFLATFN